MIEIQGASVFRGYWRQPERTAEEFTADGFFSAGDLGSLAADGYLRISGLQDPKADLCAMRCGTARRIQSCSH